MVITQGAFHSLELLAGQTISLSGPGVISIIEADGEPSSSLDFSAWPVTVGPYTINKTVRITALSGDVSATVQVPDRMDAQFVRVLTDDLPEIGQEGVLYQTETGVLMWNDWSGEYGPMDYEVPVPELADSEDADPVIAGEAQVGATLSVVSSGVWLHRPTEFAYQWAYDDDGETEISGATDSTYVVEPELEGFDIYCKLTGSNIAGPADAAAESNAIGPIVDPEA